MIQSRCRAGLRLCGAVWGLAETTGDEKKIKISRGDGKR